MPIVYSGRIALTELQALIKQCHFPAEALMLLESLPLHPVIGRSKRQELLLFRVFEPNFSFQDYNTGRVFQKSGELHWEREQDDSRLSI